MIAIELPAVLNGVCTAEAIHEGDSATIRVKGTADLRVKEALDDVFRSFSEQLNERAVRQVTVDLRELEFMNSSCFKTLLNWISQVEALPAENQYRIRFLSDPALLWQRRSLRALSCFAAGVVTIET